MRRVVLAGFVAVVVGLVAAFGYVVVRERGRAAALSAATTTADAFLGAWQDRDWQRFAGQVASPSDAAVQAHRRMVDDLAATGLQVDRGSVRLVEGGAAVDFTVSLTSEGLGPFRYDGTLDIVLGPEANGGAEDAWRVAWTPQTLHPRLAAGETLTRIRRWPARGEIRSRSGRLLAKGNEEVAVGLYGEGVESDRRVTRSLLRFTDAARADVRTALRDAAASPGAFTTVIALSRAEFEQVEEDLTPVPGIFFEAQDRRRDAADALPGQIIGNVGALSRERVSELGPPYVRGDVGGVSGLEAAFERQLAGEPGGEIRIVAADGATQTLASFEPTPPGEPVRATLDSAVQRAAQSALAPISEPSAMVVVHAPTGEVHAAANAPPGGFDRALQGGYPPGSTFKVVTTAALLRTGVVEPSTMVSCPVSANVGGQTFGNAGGEVLGEIPFRTAFFRSCNTAFVQLADELDAADLVTAAESLGFNADYGDRYAVSGGSFPRPQDAAEQAAAAIGQGRVLTTPLQMASVAAAIAGGAWRPPAFAAGQRAEAVDVPEAGTIRTLMELVVEQGTGTAAAVPGQRIGGKTGTAEFGTEDPPDTHAWFIGFRGDLAVAVVVEAGGFGGDVAAPAAARFFDAYDR